MNVLASVLFLIISFLLQSTLFSQFALVGTVPNLILISVSTIGFILGKKYGMIAGFVTGLFVDIFFGSIIGLYAMLYMYVGFTNGLFKRILYTHDIKLPLLLIVASDFIYGNLCYILMFLLKGDFRYTYYLTSVIFPEVVYTTVIAFLYFPLMQFVFTKIERFEDKAEDIIE